MPSFALARVEVCSLGLFLPLLGVSPRAGSRESGRGRVVLFASCDDDGAPSRDMAVIHERSRRTACSSEDSLSRAVWFT